MDCLWEDWFFHGGEDYELLFAASPDFNVSRYTPAKTENLPIMIGIFSDEVEGVVSESSGIRTPLTGGGFDHISALLS